MIRCDAPFSNCGDARAYEMSLDAVPHRLPRFDAKVDRLATHNFSAPFRHGYPVGFLEEERLQQHDASDVRVFVCGRFRNPVTVDARAHLEKAASSVSLAEGFPDKAGGQAGPMREETTAHYEVIRAVKFEQKRFSYFESPEPAARAGLPKVNLVLGIETREKVEPISVSDRDERVQPIAVLPRRLRSLA
jgi:hypothetical protein